MFFKSPSLKGAQANPRQKIVKRALTLIFNKIKSPSQCMSLKADSLEEPCFQPKKDFKTLKFNIVSIEKIEMTSLQKGSEIKGYLCIK